MSNINFFENGGGAPQPKDKIRIESLKAVPYRDRFRIHTEISVTPFQERPNLLLVLRDADGNTVNELDVIATMHAEMEFTIHLRNLDDPAGEYTLNAELFYETRKPPQDTASVTITIPEAEESDD